MTGKYFIINNEQGSAIVFAILLLSALTILGISSINTSSIELQIVRNERIYRRDFYIADSAWKYGAYWLEEKTKAPSKINSATSSSPDNVRNFGDGGNNVENSGFPDGTSDGDMDSIPFWYNVRYRTNDIVAGSGPNYRKFSYFIKSNANKVQEIEVGASKIYKIGY